MKNASEGKLLRYKTSMIRNTQVQPLRQPVPSEGGDRPPQPSVTS